MIELTQREHDFIASSLLYIHKLKIWSKEQDAEAKAIIDKISGGKL